MRNLKVVIFISGSLIMLSSCREPTTLLVKNGSDLYDSLPVIVKINDHVEENRYAMKSTVSSSYSEKEIRITDDSFCLTATLPSLGISNKSCSVASQVKFIIVSINDTFSSNIYDSLMRINPANVNLKLCRREAISISFLNHKLAETQ